MAIDKLDKDDPFASILAPPENETPEERAQREREDAEAQRISNGIDEELRVERVALRRQQRNIVRVLLLGQAESGKSTTLKNFRMKYAQDEWNRERASWRAVIQLNLIRSILTIVDTLEAEINNEVIYTDSAESAQTPEESSEFMPSQSTTQLVESNTMISFTETHRLLKLRLGPLRRVEKDLRRLVGAGSDEVVDSNEAPKDFQVSFRTWQDVIKRPTSPMRHMNRAGEGGLTIADEATEVIVGCREDMLSLWNDKAIRMMLKKRQVSLEDSAGFFLNDLDRIATREYEPSDDDVVRARLRTLGIQEHHIHFDQRSGIGLSQDPSGEWIIYDVGGARTVRKAWLPYFENVNAIIFLAPVSAFNERLLENASINRLEDSFLIWKLLSSSKLLSRTTLIAFLNKIDILKRKLQAGIQIKRYMPSYGDRVNEVAVAVKYFRDLFRAMHKTHSNGGIAYLYPTAVTDTKATAVTLRSVRDGILRENLKDADLV